MTRIAIIDRADMNADQARVYDAAKNGGGVVGGPYYAYIRLPQLFEASQNLRSCLHAGPLSGRERQVANLVIARHWNAQYPWCAQARGALAVGLEMEAIEAINQRRKPDLKTDRERTCHDVPREILATQGLSEASYKAAEATMGLNDFIALVANTGQFSMTCMTANTFQVDAPADAVSVLV